MSRKLKRPDHRDPIPHTYLRGETWWYVRSSKQIPDKEGTVGKKAVRLRMSLHVKRDALLSEVREVAHAVTWAIDTKEHQLVEGLQKGRFTAAELARARRNGGVPELRRGAVQPLVLKETADDWLVTREARCDASTHEGQASDLRLLISHFGAEFDMRSLTQRDAEAFLFAPQASNGGDPWSPGTRVKKRATYRHFWNSFKATEEEPLLLASNPWAQIKLRRKESNAAKEQALPLDGLKGLIKAAVEKGLKYLIFVVLTFLLAARNQEARMVRREDIKKENGNYVVYLRTVKGGDPRTLRWPKEFEPHLEEFLRDGAGKYYLLESPSERGGLMYSADTLRAWLEELCELADIPFGRGKGIVVHSGRHTLATLMINGNKTIAKVAKMLGNTPAETARTYAHLTSEDVQDDHAEVLDEHFTSTGEPEPCETCGKTEEG